MSDELTQLKEGIASVIATLDERGTNADYPTNVRFAYRAAADLLNALIYEPEPLEWSSAKDGAGGFAIAEAAGVTYRAQVDGELYVDGRRFGQFADMWQGRKHAETIHQWEAARRARSDQSR